MAKKRLFRRRRASGGSRRPAKKSFSLSLGIVAGLMPGVSQLWAAKNYGLGQVARVASRDYIGYDPDTGHFNGSFLRYGAYPLLIGVIAHFLASKLGINRALGRAGIPVIRI
jgi:hypothetical protein